ncbi:MAG: hypothetical protein KGL10_08360 [Alphaproteobacteria bacterium]|nr:hypothetical protein [Alphaproteobacteria bacterium]
MKPLRFLAVAFLCLAARPTAAAYLTGGDLLRECESGKEVNVESCMHYVAGIIDYQLMLQSLGTEPAVDFCLPRKLTADKAAAAVAVYLKKNPQLGSFIAAPSVAMALAEAYPCAQARKKRHRHGR